MNRYVFDKVFNLESNHSTSLINSLKLLNKYIKIDLIMTDKNEYVYKGKITDLLLSEITTDELLTIRNADWGIDNENKNIIKKI